MLYGKVIKGFYFLRFFPKENIGIKVEENDLSQI
jgi:hypothetical protein